MHFIKGANFIVTRYIPADINVYASIAYLNTYDFRFRLPLVEGSTTLSANSHFVYTKKDSAVTMFSRSFTNCRYTYEYKYDFHGPNAGLDEASSFLLPNVGFVYWRAYGSSASHYGFGFTLWFVRRILDYYIAP